MPRIDRFTRGGSDSYLSLKKTAGIAGCRTLRCPRHHPTREKLIGAPGISIRLVGGFSQQKKRSRKSRIWRLHYIELSDRFRRITWPTSPEYVGLAKQRIRHTLTAMKRRRQFPVGGDGLVVMKGKAPMPGGYGARWKAAIKD